MQAMGLDAKAQRCILHSSWELLSSVASKMPAQKIGATPHPRSRAGLQYQRLVLGPPEKMELRPLSSQRCSRCGNLSVTVYLSITGYYSNTCIPTEKESASAISLGSLMNTLCAIQLRSKYKCLMWIISSAAFLPWLWTHCLRSGT